MPGAACLDVRQHVERPLVARAQANLAIQARHGLGVVVEDVGRGFEHDVHGRVRALKIRDQHFDPATLNTLADRANGQREQLRAAVLAIVAIHAGDDGEFQPESRAGLGHAARLVIIHRQRAALLHRAESAAAGADVAQDHEGGGAPVPAIADVGAGRALAHGVELQVLD